MATPVEGLPVIWNLYRLWPVALAAVCFVIGWEIRGWLADSRELQIARVAMEQREILQRQADAEAAKYEQEIREVQARADDADVALRRLRQAIVSHTGPDTGATSGSNGGSVVGNVLGDCATEYRRMAREAEQLRARLVTLQNWARSIKP